MKSTKFLLLAAWLCLSLGAYAQTTYYVAPPPTGNNEEGIANDPDNPFATIEYVVEELANLDDTIQVLAGSYTENNIAIESPSLTISGLGQDVTVMLADGSTNLFSIAANGVTIEGLNISGPGTDSGATGILFLNVNPEGVENDTIRQNTISGFQSGIRFANAADISGLAISNNVINANATGISIGNGVSFANVNATTGSIYENNLSGNTTALASTSNNLVNASANWWGGVDPSQITGALSVPNNVNNRIDYNPWLNSAIDIGAEEGFQPNFLELSVRKQNSTQVLPEAVERVSIGGRIIIYNSIAAVAPYGALTLDKAVTLVGANNQNPVIAGITLNQPLGINGIITANSLTLNDNDLAVSTQIPGSTLLVPISVANSLPAQSGMITGPIEILPQTVGSNQGIQALGVTIAAGPEALGQVSIQRNAGIIAIENGSVQSIRTYWDITVDNNEFAPRELTLEWPSIYDNNIAPEIAIVWKNPGDEIVDGTWIQVNDTSINSIVSETERSITVEVSSFSQYTVSDANKPLPVELTSFSASLLEQHVELNWETASEINSDFFSVERSENGKDFKEIGSLKAAGDSDVPLQYRYIDEQAAKRFSGSLFYRLRTVDFDGSFEYSDITLVNISDDDIPMITAFAREGQQSLKIFTRGIEAGDYRVWITDLSGRKIFEQDLQLAPKEAYEIGVGNLPQSVYLIRCVGKQLALSTKFRVEEVN